LLLACFLLGAVVSFAQQETFVSDVPLDNVPLDGSERHFEFDIPRPDPAKGQLAGVEIHISGALRAAAYGQGIITVTDEAGLSKTVTLSAALGLKLKLNAEVLLIEANAEGQEELSTALEGKDIEGSDSQSMFISNLKDLKKFMGKDINKLVLISKGFASALAEHGVNLELEEFNLRLAGHVRVAVTYHYVSDGPVVVPENFVDLGETAHGHMYAFGQLGVGVRARGQALMDGRPLTEEEATALLQQMKSQIITPVEGKPLVGGYPIDVWHRDMSTLSAEEQEASLREQGRALFEMLREKLLFEQMASDIMRGRPSDLEENKEAMEMIETIPVSKENEEVMLRARGSTRFDYHNEEPAKETVAPKLREEAIPEAERILSHLRVTSRALPSGAAARLEFSD